MSSSPVAFRESELWTLVPELSNKGQAEKIQAAGLCASFLAFHVQRLEQASEEAQERFNKLLRGIPNTSDDDLPDSSVVRSLTRLKQLQEMLSGLLTSEVIRILDAMDPNPKRLGTLSGGSFIELVQRWGDRLSERLQPLDLEFFCPFRDSAGMPQQDLQTPTDEVIERWEGVSKVRDIEVNHKQIKELLLIGIRKEMNKLAPAPYILNFDPENPGTVLTLTEAARRLGYCKGKDTSGKGRKQVQRDIENKVIRAERISPRGNQWRFYDARLADE